MKFGPFSVIGDVNLGEMGKWKVLNAIRKAQRGVRALAIMQGLQPCLLGEVSDSLDRGWT